MSASHRAVGAAALLAAALLGTACSSATNQAAATARVTPRPTLDPAAPAFPTPQPVQLHPSTPAQCSSARTALITDDLFDPVVDVAHLAQRSTAVALVVARFQRSYWIPSSASTGYDPLGASPQTATDFQVLQTYKGTLPGWIQGLQSGAPVGALPQCDGGGYEVSNDSTPRVGTTYVVFLTKDEGGGVWAPTAQYARLEVRGGRAYSGQHQKPFGLSWTDVDGLTLDEVVRQVTG